jgi:hypothetical protein
MSESMTYISYCMARDTRLPFAAEVKRAVAEMYKHCVPHNVCLPAVPDFGSAARCHRLSSSSPKASIRRSAYYLWNPGVNFEHTKPNSSFMPESSRHIINSCLQGWCRAQLPSRIAVSLYLRVYVSRRGVEEALTQQGQRFCQVVESKACHKVVLDVERVFGERSHGRGVAPKPQLCAVYSDTHGGGEGGGRAVNS